MAIVLKVMLIKYKQGIILNIEKSIHILQCVLRILPSEFCKTQTKIWNFPIINVFVYSFESVQYLPKQKQSKQSKGKKWHRLEFPNQLIQGLFYLLYNEIRWKRRFRACRETTHFIRIFFIHECKVLKVFFVVETTRAKTYLFFTMLCSKTGEKLCRLLLSEWRK